MPTIITARCSYCKKPGEVELTEEQDKRWVNYIYAPPGQHLHLQDVLPDLSPGLREQLMTGIHPECFTAVFSGPEY